MRDELFERRLRSVLREGADSIPFTITASELERRVGLRRGRLFMPRRVTLLAAAAIGLGLVGVGALLGATIDRRPPVPSAPVTAIESPTYPPIGPARLPTLDDLLDGIAPDRVAVAQAHDPLDAGETSDIEIGASQIGLGTLLPGTTYELRIACTGADSITLDIRVPDSRGPGTGPEVECDGAGHVVPIAADQAQSVSFSAAWETYWRVTVIRTGDAAVIFGPFVRIPPVLTAPEGEETLIDMDDTNVVDPVGRLPDVAGRFVSELPALPARWAYRAQLWCMSGNDLRYIHGDRLGGSAELVEATTTQIPCDGYVHSLWLGLPEIDGTRAFVAATAGTRWSILVTSEIPPVALAAEPPGWQLAMGFGPDLAFAATSHSLAGLAIDGRSALLVSLACTGTKPIEVTVHPGFSGENGNTFIGRCTPDGAVTTLTIPDASENASVSYTSPAGSWTALSILVPTPSPSP